MPAFSSSFFTRLAQAILIFGFLSLAVQTADTDTPDSDPPATLLVSDVFVVKPGTEKGGCDGHDVNQWYQDAVILARAAQEALGDAVAANANGDTSADSLKQDGRQVSGHMNLKLARVLIIGPENITDVVNALIDDSDGDDKPWIFCDSTWAVEESWDDVARESAVRPNPDGLLIRELYAEYYEENYTKRIAKIDAAPTQEEKDEEDQPLFPFWSDDLNKYIFDETGDYCSKEGNLAGTDDNFQPNSMTFCPQNFPADYYAKLDDVPPVTKARVSIGDLQVTGVTFFHEAFHFALLHEHTPDIAYPLTQITRKNPLKTGKKMTAAESMVNPESYTLYALAYQLGKMNPDYTFASSASYKRKN
ncbi:hypothetical protein B0T10DRAFT_569629 [Thelonectria olida]|uniref:Uncharacterized protein n=1 Tax=Thelonectria olida TaxID=1576542 RepID=A0A9P8VNP1_9HYPO|nr:hypothetical protein B0T10DRAFT_569629 [Thelonectria olida]